MTTMEDIVTANGHQLVPWHPGQLQAEGRPVSVLPQQQDSPGQPRTTADKPGRWRGWLAAVPIVLVNAVAFCGQLAFLRVHLPWPLAGQVLVAVTLESVAVYLAWQAHLALIAADSALRLRLAAYAFAAVIGVMNYSHYMAPHWRPTFAAVTFGLMSVSSPWLWSVHSRRVSRDALLAVGDIEPHAVRLGMTRWAWHPFRSCRVMFRATWLGVTKPADAIALPPVDAPAVTPHRDSDHDKGDKLDCAPGEDRTQDRPARGRKPHRAQGRGQLRVHPPAVTKQAGAAAVIRDNPGKSNEELAALAGCDIRTIQRARNGTAKS